MPSTAPISAVITLSWRTIRRTCRRFMPSARSVPSSRVRSKVESTSVLTMPNSETITASASSTHRTARIIPIHSVWESMKASLPSALALGYALPSALATASCGPSTNVSRLRCWSNAAS